MNRVEIPFWFVGVLWLMVWLSVSNIVNRDSKIVSNIKTQIERELGFVCLFRIPHLSVARTYLLLLVNLNNLTLLLWNIRGFCVRYPDHSLFYTCWDGPISTNPTEHWDERVKGQTKNTSSLFSGVITRWTRMVQLETQPYRVQCLLRR